MNVTNVSRKGTAPRWKQNGVVYNELRPKRKKKQRHKSRKCHGKGGNGKERDCDSHRVMHAKPNCINTTGSIIANPVAPITAPAIAPVIAPAIAVETGTEARTETETATETGTKTVDKVTNINAATTTIPIGEDETVPERNDVCTQLHEIKEMIGDVKDVQTRIESLVLAQGEPAEREQTIEEESDIIEKRQTTRIEREPCDNASCDDASSNDGEGGGGGRATQTVESYLQNREFVGVTELWNQLERSHAILCEYRQRVRRIEQTQAFRQSYSLPADEIRRIKSMLETHFSK